MILRRPSLIPAAALALTTSACDGWPFGPDTVVELADIGALGADIDAVVVGGDDLAIDIMTYGRNSCVSYHHDDVEADRDARIITIRPYNERVLERACAQAVEVIPHEMQIFDLADGDWTVRVIGTAYTMPPDDDEIVVEIEVQVGAPIVIHNPNS